MSLEDWPEELHGMFTVEHVTQYADKTIGARIRSCLEDGDKRRLHWFTEHLKETVYLVFARTDISQELDRLRAQANTRGPAIYGAARKKRTASQQMRVEILQYYDYLAAENMIPEGVTQEEFYGAYMDLLMPVHMQAVNQKDLLSSLEKFRKH